MPTRLVGTPNGSSKSEGGSGTGSVAIVLGIILGVICLAATFSVAVLQRRKRDDAQAGGSAEDLSKSMALTTTLVQVPRRATAAVVDNPMFNPLAAPAAAGLDPPLVAVSDGLVFEV